MSWRVALVVTHPIQYYVPWYRALAARSELELEVLYCHRQDAQGQAAAGYGVAFDWDVPLLEGYRYRFLHNVARQPSTDRFFGCDTPELHRLLTRARYDAVLVQGWYVKSYLQAIAAAGRAGMPCLVRGDSHLHTQSSVFKRWLKWLPYRVLMRQFAAALAVGTWSRAYFRHYGVPEARIYLAPHSVDNAYFGVRTERARARRAELRARFGLSVEATVLVFVGRLIARKRVADVIEAMALVRCRNLELLVVGDGPLRGSLQALAEARGVALRCAGFLNQSELPGAYAAADLLVLPGGEAETWGLVVNEAMAAGLPAVVSDQVGAGPDLVLPGRTGAIHAHGDAGGLARILETYAAADWQRMGRMAQVHVQQWSPEAAAAAVVQCLAELNPPR